VRHIENTTRYGVPVVVAINVFASDTPSELAAVEAAALGAGARAAVVCRHHAAGGAGAAELARAVEDACASAADAPAPAFRFLYDLDLPIRDKIEAIARGVYRADGAPPLAAPFLR